MNKYFDKNMFFHKFLNDASIFSKEKVFNEFLNLNSKFAQINTLLQLKENLKLKKNLNIKEKFLLNLVLSKDINLIKRFLIIKKSFLNRKFIYINKFFFKEFNYFIKIKNIYFLKKYIFLTNLVFSKYSILENSLLKTFIGFNNILSDSLYKKFILAYKINFYIIEFIKNKFNYNMNLYTDLTKYKIKNSSMNTLLPNTIIDKNYDLIIISKMITFIGKISKINFSFKKNILLFTQSSLINKKMKLKFINTYLYFVLFNNLRLRKLNINNDLILKLDLYNYLYLNNYRFIKYKKKKFNDKRFFIGDYYMNKFILFFLLKRVEDNCLNKFFN
jgi:hypothetical protein